MELTSGKCVPNSAGNWASRDEVDQATLPEESIVCVEAVLKYRCSGFAAGGINISDYQRTTERYQDSNLEIEWRKLQQDCWLHVRGLQALDRYILVAERRISDGFIQFLNIISTIKTGVSDQHEYTSWFASEREIVEWNMQTHTESEF